MELLQKKILKNIIMKYVNKKFRNPIKQRKFLIDCIAESGYLIDKEMSSDDEEDEDLYAHMIPSSSESNENYNDQILQQSLQSHESSSVDPYGFNRTFIHVGSGGDKLAELQKRGITYLETQFNKVKDSMETLINSSLLSIDAPVDKILQTALNIYMNILIYYNTNPYSFTLMKGSLKMGYIFLCVYYSLIYNNWFIDIEKLMEHADKIRLKDLPQADKNMKMIFSGVHGYSFLNWSDNVNWSLDALTS